MNKQFFHAGEYTMTVRDPAGSDVAAPNCLDMWINTDHIIRCMITGRFRTYVLSNEDRISFTEEEPF